MAVWIVPLTLMGLVGQLIAQPQIDHPLRQDSITSRNANRTLGSGEQYFCQQSRSHFDSQDNATWCQRYFVNATYWKGTGPVLICIGGEGPPLEDDVLYDSVHCNTMVGLAPQLDAMLLAIEHRFYGKSMPNVKNLSTDSLHGLLSSQQALADLATFHTFATDKYSLQGAKWIAFGGSYPGMLASFARLLYPHLIHAAVASSAPVRAQLNFFGYLNVVAAALADPRVGGSTACAAAIAEGHAQIGSFLLTSSGKRELERDFNLCGENVLDSKNNVALWAGNGVIPINVQGNDPACTEPLCNIEKVCDAVLDAVAISAPPNREMEALAHVSNISNGGKCSDPQFDDFMKQLADTSLTNWERVWYYQTCNEFGFYQTCLNDSNCPYTRGYWDLQIQLLPCVELFNFTEAEVAANINRTNEFYGGDRPKSTRVLFVNGDVDPWHYLSVLTSPGPKLPTVWVPGDSHHFWTHPVQGTDSLYDRRAREGIGAYVKAWLQESPDSPPVGSNQQLLQQATRDKQKAKAYQERGFLARHLQLVEESDSSAYLQERAILMTSGEL